MDEKGLGECRTNASSQSLLVWNVLPHNPSLISGENRVLVVSRYKGKDKTKHKNLRRRGRWLWSIVRWSRHGYTPKTKRNIQCNEISIVLHGYIPHKENRLRYVRPLRMHSTYAGELELRGTGENSTDGCELFVSGVLIKLHVCKTHESLSQINTSWRHIEQFSIECCKTKTNVIPLTNHNRPTIQWTNQNLK